MHVLPDGHFHSRSADSKPNANGHTERDLHTEPDANTVTHFKASANAPSSSSEDTMKKFYTSHSLTHTKKGIKADDLKPSKDPKGGMPQSPPNDLKWILKHLQIGVRPGGGGN